MAVNLHANEVTSLTVNTLEDAQYVKNEWDKLFNGLELNQVLVTIKPLDPVSGEARYIVEAEGTTTTLNYEERLDALDVKHDLN